MLRYFFLSFLALVSFGTMANGIVLNSTRIIYPSEAKQVSVPVRNTSGSNTFLVQSWVEDEQGQQTGDFIVTPPLFSSAPGNENTLRLMFAGKNVLPNDRESIYYFSTKGIPSVSKEVMEGQNALILATVTRIKLFVRPSGLSMPISDAPNQLKFKRNGNRVEVSNGSPYYVTLTSITFDGKPLNGVMVSPLSTTTIVLPASKSGEMSFSTINDYGAVTPARKIAL